MIIKTDCSCPTDHITASNVVQVLVEYFLKTPAASVPSTLYYEFSGLVEQISLAELSLDEESVFEIEDNVSEIAELESENEQHENEAPRSPSPKPSDPAPASDASAQSSGDYDWDPSSVIVSYTVRSRTFNKKTLGYERLDVACPGSHGSQCGAEEMVLRRQKKYTDGSPVKGEARYFWGCPCFFTENCNGTINAIHDDVKKHGSEVQTRVTHPM